MFESLFQSDFSLQRLRNFLAVAEAGSIAKAAGDDRVRQSLFSRQIAELERFFGAQLTERRGKGIAISLAGRRLAVLVRESLQSFEDFKTDAAGRSKLFSFGAGASVLEWLMVPCLQELAGHLSGARIHMESYRSQTAVEAVREGRLDFAVIREDAIPAGLSRAPLGKIEFKLCVPSRMSGNKAESLAHVWSTLPMATIKPGGQFQQALAEAYNAAGALFQPGVECDSLLQVRALVAAGHHAGVLPSIGVGDLEKHGVIVRGFAPLRSYGRALCLHWNERQMARRGLEKSAVVALAATLKESFKAAQTA